MKRENDSVKNNYLSEIALWQNFLDSLLHENALLKTKLASVLDENNSKTFLALAEDFQNSFIAKDELLMELSDDISMQKELINKSNTLTQLAALKQQKLRNEINRFEKNFSNLRQAFTQFLASSLQN